MKQEWFYAKGGKKHGPVSGAELKQLASSGQLLPDDMVKKEGIVKWASARSIKGLFPEAAAGLTPVRPLPPSAAASPSAVPVSVASPQTLPATPSMLARAKAAWRKAGVPVRISVIGGGVFVLLLILMVPIVLLTVLLSSKSPSVLLGDDKAILSGGEKAIEVVQLAKEYDDDQNAADAKYKEKLLTVKAIVEQPPTGGELWLETPMDLKHSLSVWAEFSAKYESDLATLRRGDTVLFRGVCKGLDGLTVNLQNCELILPAEKRRNESPQLGLTQPELDQLTSTVAAIPVDLFSGAASG